MLPKSFASVVSWGGGKGTLSMSTASELLRLGDLVTEAIPDAIANNLTKDEARQVVQLHQRSGKSISDCMRQSLLTRPRIEHLELIIGSLLSPAAIGLASVLGNEESTRLLSRRMAARFPEIVCKAVRVNGDRFSIMLDSEAASALRQHAGSSTVEQVITDLLSNGNP